MIEQAHSDPTLFVIFLLIAMIIPGIVMWFDDGKIHGQ